jgi:hypothetical protein
MIFVQQYTRHEQQFGSHKLRFVISDVYNDLFKTDAQLGITSDDYIDIFDFGNVNQKLNTDDGYYSADEMTISIDESVCNDEHSKNALHFIYEAVNLNKNRYCVLFFDPDFSSEDNLLNSIWFLGKVSDKISGEDLKISGSEYDENIDPLRTYEFTAYSFDVSLFKDVKLTSKTKDWEGNDVRPLFNTEDEDSRIKEADINSIFNTKLFYGLQYEDLTTENYYLKPLGSLYDALVLLLNKSSDIIAELTNSTLSIDLVPGSLGFSVNPTDYDFDDYKITVNNSKSSTKRIELKLDPTINGTSWSNPFIHRRMFNPALGHIQDEYGNYTGAFSLEKQMSFWQYDNLTELLSDIARSFGVFPFLKYKSGNNIELSFVSRQGIISDEYTQIIDWTKGNIDISSILNQDDIEFKAQSTPYSTDGNDTVEVYWDRTVEPLIQGRFGNSERLEQLKKDAKDGTVTLTLFSSGYTLVRSVLRDYAGAKIATTTKYYPFNISNSDNANSFNTDQAGGYPELLHNSVYVTSKPLTTQQETVIGSTTDIWRPINKVYAEINGEVVEKDTLSELVNYLLAKDKQYYETEYKITVPFWSGFKTSSKDAKWDNLTLGSKVRLIENNKKVYDEVSGSFIDNPVTKDFIVVAIERNTNYPETTFTLHNISRFALSPVTSDTISSIMQVVSYQEETELDDVNTAIAGENINEGWAVMIDADNKLYHSLPKAENYEKTVGIALNSGIAGEKINYQFDGIYKNESMNLIPGKLVFIRNLATPNTNISQEFLQPDLINDNENMVCYLGTAISTNEIKIKKEDLIYDL